VGIRARLTIGMAVLLLAGFGLLGVVVVHTTHAALIEEVDARIRAATIRMGPYGGSSGHGGSQDGGRRAYRLASCGPSGPKPTGASATGRGVPSSKATLFGP
jgi:hypothetical protein